MALEPWNQCSHLGKLNKHPGLLLKSRGQTKRLLIHQFVSKLQKFIEGAVHSCPWIATDLSPTHPWPATPQLLGRSTLSGMVPAALPTRAAPDGGASQLCICECAGLGVGGGLVRFSCQDTVSPRWYWPGSRSFISLSLTITGLTW